MFDCRSVCYENKVCFYSASITLWALKPLWALCDGNKISFSPNRKELAFTFYRYKKYFAKVSQVSLTLRIGFFGKDWIMDVVLEELLSRRNDLHCTAALLKVFIFKECRNSERFTAITSPTLTFAKHLPSLHVFRIQNHVTARSGYHNVYGKNTVNIMVRLCNYYTFFISNTKFYFP